MKTNTSKQQGFAHIFLFVAIFVVVLGAVGFVGYTSWQKQNNKQNASVSTDKASDKNAPAISGKNKVAISELEGRPVIPERQQDDSDLLIWRTSAWGVDPADDVDTSSVTAFPAPNAVKAQLDQRMGRWGYMKDGRFSVVMQMQEVTERESTLNSNKNINYAWTGFVRPKDDCTDKCTVRMPTSVTFGFTRENGSWDAIRVPNNNGKTEHCLQKVTAEFRLNSNKVVLRIPNNCLPQGGEIYDGLTYAEIAVKDPHNKQVIGYWTDSKIQTGHQETVKIVDGRRY